MIFRILVKLGLAICPCSSWLIQGRGIPVAVASSVCVMLLAIRASCSDVESCVRELISV